MNPDLKAPQPAPALGPIAIGRRLWLWLNALFIDHALFRFFYNLRTRVSPDVYRSAHPMPYQLALAKRAGIKSVINLRGLEPQIGANPLEWEACKKLGLEFWHFPMRSRDPPTREEVLGFDALIANIAKPVLLHCKSGADRAGLASALYLLMQENAPLDVALKQMEFWRHGHIRQAKTGVLDHFFETYRAHHAAHGTPFREWIENHYDREAVTHSFHASWWANQLVDLILRRE